MIDRSPRYSRAAIELLAAIVVGVIAAVFWSRYHYPLELEWMEANTLRAAERIRAGEALYAAPSDAWVPALYTPFYPWLLAKLSGLGALDYPMARMLSIASVVATCAGLYVGVRGEDKPRAHALTAVALVLSGFVFTFRWMDVARADSLFMALALWSLVLLRRGRRETADSRQLGYTVAAGVLMALAFWTKQTAAVFVVAGGVAALMYGTRTFLAFATPIAIICGGGVVWGNGRTEGWLWIYIYEMHQTHAMNWERFWSKTWLMFLHAMPFVVGWVAWRSSIAMAHLVSPPDARDEFGKRRTAEGGERYWALMAVAGLLVAALGYSTQWAEPNAFIPGVTLLAAWIGVAQPMGGATERVGTWLVGLQIAFSGLVEANYHVIKTEGWGSVLSSYRVQAVDRSVPSADAVAQAHRFVEERAHWPGPLFAPQHEWWARTRGETPAVSSMGLNDLTKKQRREVHGKLRQRVRAREFGTIWIDGSLGAGWNWLRPELEAGYRLAERRRGAERVRPMVGFMSDAGMAVPYRGEQLRFERVTAPVPAREDELVIADFEHDFRPFDIEGFGFSRGPVPSIHAGNPAIGPISGARFLSSAASRDGVAGMGKATSQPFALPAAGGELRLLAGRVGTGDGVTISLHELGGDDRWVAIEIPGHHYGLAPVHWSVSEAWANTRVVMVIEDQSRDSAVFLDRISLITPSSVEPSAAAR